MAAAGGGMTRTVYISGPITGIPDLNRFAFSFVEGCIRARGLTPVNPHTLCDPSLSWSQCMRADIAALCACDAILLLPGWERSNGAQLEVHVAHRLGIEVLTDLDALKQYAESLRGSGYAATAKKVTA